MPTAAVHHTSGTAAPFTRCRCTIIRGFAALLERRMHPVDQCLHLRVHLVEIDRCRQHDHVCRSHLIQDICDVILLHTLAGLLAGIAGRAETHLFAMQAHHFHHVSAFFCAARELCAQGLRIAALARCKNRHPSPICMQFGHHPAGVSAPLSRSEAPMPYNWFSTAIL